MTARSTSFDVQTYTNGNWRTISAFRTRQEAITKAQMLKIGPAHQAIRVVHEAYDPLRGRFSHQTVFRRSALNQGRIDTARADLAVTRLLRNQARKQAASHAAAAGTGDEWQLVSAFGLRVLALMSGGALAMAVFERMVSS